MKKNFPIILTGLCLLVVSLFVTFVNYPVTFHNEVELYAINGSYASEYAKKNSLSFKEITSGEVKSYTKNVEFFTYDVIDGGISIVKYEGVSKDLVIPKIIDDKKVVSIEAKAFEGNKNVEKIFISENVASAKVEGVTIACYKGKYCDELTKDEDLDVVVMNDSERVDFDNGSTEFEYEIANGSAVIVKYYGKDKVAVVPSRINGYEVKKLSYTPNDGSKLYVPSSVVEFGEKFLASEVNVEFVTLLVVEVVSFIAFLLGVVSIGSKKLSDMSANSLIYVVAFVYLAIVEASPLYLNKFDKVEYFVLFHIVALFVYAIVMLVLGRAKKTTKEFEDERKASKSFIKEASLLLDEVDGNDEYKLKEVVRFSDPMSVDEVADIERKILERLHHLDAEAAEEIRDLFRKRNSIIKKNKK